MRLSTPDKRLTEARPSPSGSTWPLALRSAGDGSSNNAAAFPKLPTLPVNGHLSEGASCMHARALLAGSN